VTTHITPRLAPTDPGDTVQIEMGGTHDDIPILSFQGARLAEVEIHLGNIGGPAEQSAWLADLAVKASELANLIAQRHAEENVARLGGAS
jgi:hypothetical protein